MTEEQMLMFAGSMIQRNQGNIPNTPWAQAAINAIMNGDAKAGANIADNLCNAYGVSREDALKQASQSIKF